MRDRRRNLDWVELEKNQYFAVGHLDNNLIFVEDEYDNIESVKTRIKVMKDLGYGDDDITVSVIEELKFDVS